jgi:hypothetical protein
MARDSFLSIVCRPTLELSPFRRKGNVRFSLISRSRRGCGRVGISRVLRDFHAEWESPNGAPWTVEEFLCGDECFRLPPVVSNQKLQRSAHRNIVVNKETKRLGRHRDSQVARAMPERCWLTSWALDAVSSAIVVTRVICARSACVTHALPGLDSNRACPQLCHAMPFENCAHLFLCGI